MSMWRAIPTVFGPLAERPEPEDLPYGTQWHDPTTGITYATDETQWYQIGTADSGAAGGSVGPWIGNTLDPGLTDEALTLLDGRRLFMPICEEANVECVTVYLSDQITYGAVEVQLTVNGVQQGDPVVVEDDDCATAELGVYVAPCDVIGFTVTTSGDLEHPASAEDLDVTVVAQFGAPTPPVQISVSHGLVFGHQVAGNVEGTVTAQVQHGLVFGHEVTGDIEVPSTLPSNPFFRVRATSLALANNDPVGSWTDEGSGGNDLSQSGTARPTYESAGFNGHPSVLFDGSDDFMESAVAGFFLEQPITIVIMGEYVTVSTTAEQYLFDGGASFSRTAVYHNGATGGDPWVQNDGSPANTSASPVGREGDDLCIVAAFDEGGSGDLNFYVNNGSDLQANSAIGSALDQIKLGARFNDSSFVNFRFVEVLVYDRILNSTERTNLQTYFTNTWG